ncbi:MAG: hypothetical protein CSB33_05370 [Desulfobacterales bacterium]|nr:MAG: hypothetical protein CSB33_05370 [Desulfobacterales bacterium]
MPVKKISKPRWAIRPRVPEPVYTDRREFIEYFHHAALEAIHRRTMSTVLLGQRRMGKTEIFKRTVNRLFWEQDHTDPAAVVPVYYSFPDEPEDRWVFAAGYVENFIPWNAAFRLRDPRILSDDFVPGNDLGNFVKSRMEIPEGFSGSLNLFRFLREKGVTHPERSAVTHPQRATDYDDTTAAIFLDEFQNTRLPRHEFSIVGYMQEAVESPTCPHFVTGSAMSILAREIIGRGSLFGRFAGMDIEPMTGYWGAELALRSAQYYRAELPEEMAPVLAVRCGGNPFYITAVVRQSARQGKALTDENKLNEILAVDLSSGFIWGELNDQVTRWIERINERINDQGITKWILYLSALDENTETENRGRLNVERIRRELLAREGKDVPPDTIRDVLIKLSRGDLLEYLELGGWFRKTDDPILLEFLKVWGRIEVEGRTRREVRDKLRLKYGRYRRRVNEYKGYLAETFMAQILWNGQRKTLPGGLFHGPKDIEMPWQFTYVRQRMRLESGKAGEIDVFGAAGGDYWVCQSKWWTDRKVDIQVLKAMEAQGETIAENMDILSLRLWLFAYSGLAEDAEAYARERGILWSSLDEFNEILELVGLRKLPEL